MLSTSSKKVLIISSWAPPMVGGPQNLYNIFSQCNKDSYVILTTFNDIVYSGSKKTGTPLEGKYYFCDQFSLNKRDELKKEFVNLTHQVKSSLTKNQEILVKIKTFITDKFRNTIIIDIMKILISLISLPKIFKFTKSGKRLVEDQEIEIIIGISDYGPAMISSYLISKASKKPLFIYLFDIYKENILPPFYGILARYYEPRMFKQANCIIVTNEGTQRYYQNRYPKIKDRIKIIYNSVFTKDYERKRSPYKPNPPYIIIFTGNIYWAQEQSILNLIKSMDLLSDLPLELHLYVPKSTIPLEKILKNKKNIILSAANQSEMPKVQNSATLLFLPLSWDTKSPDIIATATPGKFTDYLASGRPMLVHAPDYAYVSKYTKENQLGLVVDKNDVQLLADTIRNFLKDPSVGQQYINNALKIFYQNHNARKNAEKLTKLLEMV